MYRDQKYQILVDIVKLAFVLILVLQIDNLENAFILTAETVRLREIISPEAQKAFNLR